MIPQLISPDPHTLWCSGKIRDRGGAFPHGVGGVTKIRQVGGWVVGRSVLMGRKRVEGWGVAGGRRGRRVPRGREWGKGILWRPLPAMWSVKITIMHTAWSPAADMLIGYFFDPCFPNNFSTRGGWGGLVETHPTGSQPSAWVGSAPPPTTTHPARERPATRHEFSLLLLYRSLLKVGRRELQYNSL